MGFDFFWSEHIWDLTVFWILTFETQIFVKEPTILEHKLFCDQEFYLGPKNIWQHVFGQNTLKIVDQKYWFMQFFTQFFF